LSFFLNLGPIWRKLVSFTCCSLLPWENNPHYPLNNGLGGSQSRSGCYGEKKSLGIKPQFLGHPACNLVGSDQLPWWSVSNFYYNNRLTF
jgi:hypothetical protein